MLFEPPTLGYVAGVVVDLADPLDVGVTPEGRRRVVPITGGTVHGPDLAGRVVPGGADWQRVLPDGTTLVEARYTLELDERAGAERLVSITSTGVRTGPEPVLAALARGEHVDRSLYYFRLAIRAATASAHYSWLNTSVLVASAERTANAVRYDLYRLE